MFGAFHLEPSKIMKEKKVLSFLETVKDKPKKKNKKIIERKSLSSVNEKSIELQCWEKFTEMFFEKFQVMKYNNEKQCSFEINKKEVISLRGRRCVNCSLKSIRWESIFFLGKELKKKWKYWEKI